MKLMKVTCDNCSGFGDIIKWKIVYKDEEKGVGEMRNEKIVCPDCNGKGYIEHVTFSLEEAEVIMKHCGLSANC